MIANAQRKATELSTRVLRSRVFFTSGVIHHVTRATERWKSEPYLPAPRFHQQRKETWLCAAQPAMYGKMWR